MYQLLSVNGEVSYEWSAKQFKFQDLFAVLRNKCQQTLLNSYKQAQEMTTK